MATAVENSILSLKNNLEEKIVMSNKTIEFAKSKGQKVGDEDQKIVGDLVAREKNASWVYANASQVKNKTTMDYLLEKQALNRTEEELKTLVPQDSTGGVEITGPTGSMSGSTGITGASGMTGAKVRATGANDINAATTGPGAKSASGNSAKVRATGANDINAAATGPATASGSISGGAESGATGVSGSTGATGMIPDNIAETGVIEATAGEQSATGFSKEHSPLTLTEQSRRLTMESQYGNGGRVKA